MFKVPSDSNHSMISLNTSNNHNDKTTFYRAYAGTDV